MASQISLCTSCITTKKPPLLILLLLLTWSSEATAQQIPLSETSLAALHRVELEAPGVQAAVLENVGTIRRLYDFRYHSGSSRESDEYETIAQRFVSACADLFGLQDGADELRFVKIDSIGPGRVAVKLRQFKSDVPVWGGGYVIGVGTGDTRDLSRGDIFYVAARYFPIGNAVSSLTEFDANPIEVPIGATLVGEPTLVIYPLLSGDSDVAYALAYHVAVQRKGGGTSLPESYFMDAISGNVISRVRSPSGGVAPLPKMPRRLLLEERGAWWLGKRGNGGLLVSDGESDVIKSSAVLACSTQPCGTVHRPNPDDDASGDDEEIKGTTNGQLSGTRVEVRRSSLSGSITQETGSGDYYFDPDTEAEEYADVNAYYHVQNANDIGIVSFIPSMYRSEVKVVTYSTYCSAACSVPGANAIFLSDEYSEHWANAAFSGGVIVHEYMHLITERIGSFYSGDEETLALWKAISDFYGIVYKERLGSTSAVIGEYLDTGHCFERNIDSGAYWAGFGEEDVDGCNGYNYYDDSMIMSGIMWDFYHMLEAPYNSQYLLVIAAAIALLPELPDFEDMLYAVHDNGFCVLYECEADWDAAIGSHGGPTIDARRAGVSPFLDDSRGGVYERVEYLVGEGTAGQGEIENEAPFESNGETVVGSFPNPVRVGEVVRFVDNEAVPVLVHLYDALGRRIHASERAGGLAGLGSVSLNTSGMKGGVYYLVAISKNRRIVVPVIVVD